ncbi:hypothetical protein BKA82DRAFT_20479 [Pisolithus tinctorius]|uniref:Uncharacterized protein n=1 Tax=Pisolithus tinctorius Marx 270 TaxID=870435 RepID=A0A0C3PDP9_PISTI|nr:hypothetical protein BKA82DRAFT_20479 [Pisolithus tinctorius]KIO11900.1 hypothetical protein M404DRAFT_20479 [Pisolithus tinctorius Marx 270]
MSLAGYHSENLALDGTAVLNDLGGILQASLEYFKSAALPPLRGQIDIAKIKTSLEDADAWSGDSGWTAIKKVPILSGVSEEDVFEPLSKVFDEVISIASLAFATLRLLQYHSPGCLLLVEKKSIDLQEAKKSVPAT